MNLVKRAASQVGAGLSISDFDRVLDSLYGGSPSYTGKLVSQTTALAVDAVWACVDLISSDIARLPLLTYRTIDEDRELAKDHYLYTLLLQEANPELTAFRFKQLMQTWLLLWGNAYAEIEINLRGQVTALWPWRPDRVTVTRAGSPTGPLQYSYRLGNGTQLPPVAHHYMLHLRGLGTDGIFGLSPIEVHKQMVGLSLAIEEHGARFFSGGARPLGVLQIPTKLGDIAYNRLREDWNSKHQGLENAHRMAILEEGLTWKDTGSNMVDAQYIEAAGLTAAGIGRIYGVPQHKIGLLDRSTNNNISQQGLDYIQSCIGKWTSNWTQEIEFSLLSQRERLSISTDFELGDLIQGDYATMGTFMAMLTDRGIANADECRQKYLKWNPQPGGIGKLYFKGVNMAPVDAQREPDGSPLKTPMVEPKVPPPLKNGKLNGVAH